MALPASRREVPETRRCLELNVKVLYFFGFWPDEGEERRNWWFYWRYLIPRVAIVRSIYGCLFHVINISIVWGDLPHMAEYLVVLFLHMLYFATNCTLFFYRDDLKAVFDELNALHDPRMVFDDVTRLCLMRTETLTNRYLKNFFIWGGVIDVVSHLFQIVDGFFTRSIPFRLWLPYDYKNTPVFEVTLLCTAIAAIVDIFMVGTCFVTFVGVAVTTIGQFKLLTYKLLTIRENVKKKMNKKDHRQTFAENPQLSVTSGGVGTDEPFTEIAFDNQNDITGFAHSVIVMSQLRDVRATNTQSMKSCVSRNMHKILEGVLDDNLSNISTRAIAMDTINNKLNVETISDSIGTLYQDNVTSSSAHTNLGLNVDRFEEEKCQEDLEMETYLRHCIKHHQKLLRVCKKLGRVFKVQLGQYVWYGALGGIPCLYLTTLAKSMDSKMGTVCVLVACLYLQILCLCLIGGQISEEAENARDAVYDCDWFGASESFKRSMRIMISRMNRPLVIKAGGLPLSVGTFRLICRAAYYGHVVLSKLLRGEKIMKAG